MPFDYLCPGRPYNITDPIFGIQVGGPAGYPNLAGVTQGLHHWEMTFLYDLSLFCGVGIVGESTSVATSDIIDIVLNPVYAGRGTPVQLSVPGIAGTNGASTAFSPPNKFVAPLNVDIFNPSDFPPIIGRGLYRTKTGDSGVPRLSSYIITGEPNIFNPSQLVPETPIRYGDYVPDEYLGHPIPTGCGNACVEVPVAGVNSDTQCPVNFTRVATIDTPGSQQGYGAGVANIGNGEMLAFVSSNDSAPYGGDFNPQRLFRSTNNGRTWTEIAPYLEPTTYSGLANWIGQPSRLISVGTGKAIVIPQSVVGTNAIGAAADGYLQEDGVTPGAGLVPYTEDRGATWRNLAIDLGTTVGGVPPGSTFVDSAGSVGGLVTLDGNEMWFTGFYEDLNAGDTYGYIKTTGIGSSWSFGALMDTITGSLPGNPITMGDGIYAGNNRVILGLQAFSVGGAPHVAVSNNRGTTWTQVTLPVNGISVGNINGYAIQAMARLDDGAIIIGGSIFVTLGDDLPRMWRSTDGGATWSDISSSVPNLATGEPFFGVMHILSLGGTRAIVSVSGQDTEDHVLWAHTEDSGVSWVTADVGNEEDAPNTAITDSGAALTGGGAVAGTLDNIQIEGWGDQTSGGTGQPIYHITTTSDTGTQGSLRHALSAGNRYIVFDVGGIFVLNDAIDVLGDFWTLDGATAPSPVTITGDGGIHIIDRQQFIMSNLRFRNIAPSGEADAVQITTSNYFVMNKISVYNATDGNIDISGGCEYGTVQWCILSSGKQMLIGATGSLPDKSTERITVHHCVFVGEILENTNGGHDRYPLVRAGGYVPAAMTADIRNNIFHGWLRANGTVIENTGRCNLINNVYAPATDTSASDRANSVQIDTPANNHTSGNVDVGAAPVNNYNSKGAKASAWPVPPVTTHSALEAAALIVANAGVLPRDATDTMLLARLPAF